MFAPRSKNDFANTTPLDIDEVIREALVLAGDELQRHRILVQAHPPEPLPDVHGDRVQLEQVLLNLITNAIQSMAENVGPRVLGVTSEIVGPDGVMVSVADIGTGIAPQDVDRIFTPLFTTKGDGMGMGFSISRSIIEAHDGRLWVAPNNPRGAVFQFTLPANTPMAASA